MQKKWSWNWLIDNDAPASLFVSPSKKRIFEYICNNPGSYLYEIGGEVDMPTMTVKRYLDHLVETGIVRIKKFKGKAIYYPSGLRDDDVEAAYSQLRHEDRRTIFTHVLDNPGSTRASIVARLMISHRQVCRLLESMEDARLFVQYKDGKAYRYDLGDVGKKIVIGSIETVYPFVEMIREASGYDVSVSMDVINGKNIAHVTLMNGDSISIELGRWNMVDIDEQGIIDNAELILAEGGKDVLMAIDAGCNSEETINLFTGTKPKIIRAKLRTMRLFGLVIDYTMTELGKKVVKKIKKIE